MFYWLEMRVSGVRACVRAFVRSCMHDLCRLQAVILVVNRI